MESATRSVLIVSRERLIGDLLCDALARRRYSCATETQPTLAVERFVAERPVLTIVDVAALEYEGLEIIAGIRRQDADAVIVAMMGLGTAMLESTVYNLGVTDVVRRHQDLRQMLNLVDDLGEKGAPAVGTTSGLPEESEQPAVASILDEPTTVLVVDDDAAVRRLLERVLAREGYRVLTASDGVEALDCLDREEVHLMFLDLRLPRLGGLAILRRLQERRSPPRTVIISGIADRGLKREALKLGAFDYLQKPLSVDRVLVTASAAVVLERARRRSFWQRWTSRFH